jgi:hypothetical protein
MLARGSVTASATDWGNSGPLAGMPFVLTMAAVVALGLAGWNFYAVLDELRRSLPPQFTEEELRWAIGYYVWTPAASDAARRREVWSYLWASLGFLLEGAALWLLGHLIVAALLGGVAVAGTAYILCKSCRYRIRASKI